jgi:hypothetical protein
LAQKYYDTVSSAFFINNLSGMGNTFGYQGFTPNCTNLRLKIFTFLRIDIRVMILPQALLGHSHEENYVAHARAKSLDLKVKTVSKRWSTDNNGKKGFRGLCE